MCQEQRERPRNLDRPHLRVLVCVFGPLSGRPSLSSAKNAVSGLFLPRRQFLLACGQMSGALLVPAVLPYQAFCDRSDLRTSSTEFHLHPHYPTKMPLDTTLLKVPLGSDEFVSEKYAGQLSRVLEQWRTRLLESAADLASLETTLGEEFLGSSCLPRSSEPF